MKKDGTKLELSFEIYIVEGEMGVAKILVYILKGRGADLLLFGPSLWLTFAILSRCARPGCGNLWSAAAIFDVSKFLVSISFFDPCSPHHHRGQQVTPIVRYAEILCPSSSPCSTTAASPLAAPRVGTRMELAA